VKRFCLVLFMAVGQGLAGATGGAAQDRAAFLAGTVKDCRGCDLRGASLDRRDLAGADLSGANLRGATFSRTILRGANLSGADLAGANLKRHDLAGANLSAADLHDATFHRAVLRGANLSGADLTGANLNLAVLTSAKLERATMVQAMLFQAEANGADFTKANLTAALMGSARLTVAKLDGADLSFTDLWEASGSAGASEASGNVDAKLFEFLRKRYRGVSFKTSTDFVLAFQLTHIKYNIKTEEVKTEASVQKVTMADGTEIPAEASIKYKGVDGDFSRAKKASQEVLERKDDELPELVMIPDIEWLYYLLHQAPAFPLPSCKSHSTGKAMKGGSCLCLAFPGP